MFLCKLYGQRLGSVSGCWLFAGTEFGMREAREMDCGI